MIGQGEEVVMSIEKDVAPPHSAPSKPGNTCGRENKAKDSRSMISTSDGFFKTRQGWMNVDILALFCCFLAAEHISCGI